MFGVYLRQDDLLPIELEELDYGMLVKHWYYKKIYTADSAENAAGYKKGYMAGKENFKLFDEDKPDKLIVMPGCNDWVLLAVELSPF